MRPAIRPGGGGGNVAAGIAISAVLLALAAGAVLYSRSQDPVNAEPRPAEESPRKKKSSDPPQEAAPKRVITDIFTKEASVVPNGSFELVLSSDKKGQIEFEILPKDGPVDIAMIRVKTADAITPSEQAELRSKFKRYEAGGPHILRERVLPGEVQYCSIANPGPRPVAVTATGRTITE
jgi:hypothetical protein